MTASPDRTTITKVPAITDANGNVWTLTAIGGKVAMNGVPDTTTGGVMELAIVGGLIYQKNQSNLWWSKSRPSDAWTPAGGSSLSPLASPDRTTVTTAGPAISDADGNLWTMTAAGGQVAVNGVPDTTTGRVMELAFVGGKLWQQNQAGRWWWKILPTDTWQPSGGTATSPLAVATESAPPAPSQAVAAGFTTPVLHTEFTSAAVVSNDLSGRTIAGLYPWNNFGQQWVVGPNGYSIANNILKISQATPWGAGLATACSGSCPVSSPAAHATNTGTGLAFNQGYFEIVFSFDYTNTDNRAIWMNYGCNGTSALEIDIMESFPKSGGGIDLGCHIISWQPSPAATDGSSHTYILPDLPNSAFNLTPGAYNTVGFLWSPTHLQMFANNVGGAQIPTTTPIPWFNGNNSAVAGNFAFNSYGTNGGHPLGSEAVYLQLGTWGAPLFIQRVTVYQ